MKTFLQYLIESVPPFNLRAIFNELNEKMFDSPRRLPQIPISFGSLAKGVAGITQFKYNSSMRKIVDNSMFIKISPLVTTEKSLYSVVAHEIIHARLALDGFVYENHGHRFVEMAKHLSAKLGIEISISHEFTANDLDSVKEKRVAAFINQRRDGAISFSLISDTKAQEMINQLEKWARGEIQRGNWTSSWFGLIDTKLHKLVPVSRTVPKSNTIMDKKEQDKYGNQLSNRHSQFFYLQ